MVDCYSNQALFYRVYKEVNTLNIMSYDELQFFFLEWLIIEKDMTKEEYTKLTDTEIKYLLHEFSIIK